MLNGSVRYLGIDRTIIEVGGVGLTVHVTSKTISQLTLGAQVQLFTSLVVREDSLTLYGFLTSESRELFELVQTVAGIGPKVALSIIGALSPEELGSAIAQEKISVIEKVPGIGRKGAQRLILELKGKLSDYSTHATAQSHLPQWREQLSSALVSLGFSPREADSAISLLVSRLQIEDRDPAKVDLSELLKDALANGRSARDRN